MDTKRILAHVLEGRMTLAEVEQRVAAAKPAFNRPPVSTATIDTYLSWEDKAQSLSQELSEMIDATLVASHTDTDRAIVMAQVAHAIAPLLSNSTAPAQSKFVLGYVLWRAGNYSDAIDPLTDAAAVFRDRGIRLNEVDALYFRLKALFGSNELEAALAEAERLIVRSQELGIKSHQAAGLCVKGDILTELGRAKPALETLRQAIDLRRELSAQEEQELVVMPLAGFLNVFGKAARRFGVFEHAISAFFEMAELEEEACNLDQQAFAISEIGFTYVTLGETERGIRYLAEAIPIAEAAGDWAAANRWRLFVATRRGEDVGAEPIPSWIEIHSTEEAYQRSVEAENLATKGQYDSALTMAQAVLEWAQKSHDNRLEISARSVRAAVYSRQDDLEQAIAETRSAILVADRVSEESAMLLLRSNLANGLVRLGRNSEAIIVLLDGIARAQTLFAETEGSEFRQAILAGASRLFEQCAHLYSHFEMHESLLWITELARARNLAQWLEAEVELVRSAAPANSDTASVVKRLRAVEVELEVRHLARRLDTPSVQRLIEDRRAYRDRLDVLRQQLGLPSLSRDAADKDLGSLKNLPQKLLRPKMAILCLFSIPEGICPSILYQRGDETVSAGRFISWDRADRLAVLERWAGNRDFRQGRGRFSVSQRDAVRLKARQTTGIEKVIASFRAHFFDDVIELLAHIQPRDLVVVPHRELALIPYWQFLDEIPSIQSITLAPSLSVIDLCLARQRPLRGETTVLGDLTETLPQAEQEVEWVKEARSDHAVYEPATMEMFLEASQRSALLHIAAHGLFNSENPYHSGFLAAEQEQGEGIFVQYAARDSLSLSDTPGPDSIRLVTVAECMAELSLEACRLAVLSTCESGISRQHSGGEMTGLPAAILVAGAKSCIVSLWPVHDTATALLMHYFYETWEGGKGAEPSPARALAVARQQLQTAKRAEISKKFGARATVPEGKRPFAHPIYTDAFHCFGSW